MTPQDRARRIVGRAKLGLPWTQVEAMIAGAIAEAEAERDQEIERLRLELQSALRNEP